MPDANTNYAYNSPPANTPTSSSQSMKTKGSGDDYDHEESPAECTAVQEWCRRIRFAKNKSEADFKRMRQNMDFMAGLQWESQESVDYHKYVCNITMQMVNQKVATLYAKEPKVVCRRRDRLDFQLWDGRLETLANAIQRASMSMQTGFPDMEAEALIADYQRGRMWQEQVQRVGRTLEILYKYEMDAQECDFKECMKQLVTNAITCGVGYVRINWVRRVASTPSATMAPSSVADRLKKAKVILEKIEKGEIEQDDAQLETLKQLMQSFGAASQPEESEVQERLLFDFPPSTSIIVDSKCRNLKTFAGARWMAQEYLLPLEEVNTFFGTHIKPGGELKILQEGGEEATQAQSVLANLKGEVQKPVVCLWEVFDATTKSRFFVVDGHKYFVMKPEPFAPATRRFWPMFSLVFNPVVKEGGSKATVYPQSDVQLMKHPQKEWNRSRNSLRGQRRANAPKYAARKGLLTQKDIDALDSAEENEVIELEGIPADQKPGLFIEPMVHAPIDPAVYDTKPLEEDIMLSTRAQEANIGPARPHVTATVGTIAEQSRVTVAASNVDDLDSVLTCMAKYSGEILLREMSPQTVMRIVGPGATWPLQNRDDFLNEIYLEIEASSSGRPNKALEVSNFERLAPLLLQFGANPMFMVREGVKRLDDRLDVSEAFPMVPPAPVQGVTPAPSQGGPQQLQSGQPATPGQQPLQTLPPEAPPVPLAAA